MLERTRPELRWFRTDPGTLIFALLNQALLTVKSHAKKALRTTLPEEPGPVIRPWLIA